jgi:hypothetical protein
MWLAGQFTTPEELHEKTSINDEGHFLTAATVQTITWETHFCSGAMK